jgi:hypothetical protein
MSRLSAILLFAAWLTCQVGAQAGPGQNASQPSSSPPAASEPAAGAGKVAGESENPDFPLHKFKEFSAVMVGSISIGDNDEGHIYRSGDLMRMEGRLHVGYYITDLRTQETYAMSKTGCMKNDRPYTRTFPFIAGKAGSKVERTPVGKETIDGHVCQVEDVNIVPKSGMGTLKMRLWEADDLQGFPVKIEMRGNPGPKHRSFEYKNVVLGPQDPTLFIYPKDCQAVTGQDDDDDEEEGAPAAKPANPPAKKPPTKNPSSKQ